jgi:cytochrome c biogenesis protein CcdA
MAELNRTRFLFLKNSMMNYLARIAAFTLLFIHSVISLFSQDSAAYNWSISSKKISENKYELILSTNGVDGWQLYAPAQTVPDLLTTELKFEDSAISQQGTFDEDRTWKEVKSQAWDGQTVKIYNGPAKWRAVISIAGTVPARLQGQLSYSYGRGNEFYTGAFPFNVSLEGGIATEIRIRIPTIDISHPLNNCGDDVDREKTIWGIFILGLLGGFIALLTPCVFPMIPLTVSFFTKQGQNKGKGVTNAIFYGLSIFVIYVLLSLPFHIFHASPQVLNNFSTNVWLNLFFFAVFIVFAISFFGYFEITLPAGLANKASARSGLSTAGIFFMAFTLAIVSFSCTGPILGSLLAGTVAQGSWPLTAGLAGFGFALALPFTLFAIFPNWLQSLPKSGGWLNSVKVVLGFLEIAMAIKFLSNADLVKQWGFLKREIFVGLWVVIGIAIVLYLLGKIRFPHDSRVKKFSRTRVAFIILFSAATLYLLPGITNTKSSNLRLISGFPPPLCYSIYSNPVNCKRGFEPLRDYEVALQKARKENKPILIDFTGWACVNCRRMEEAVWTNPAVDSLMRKEFVVVSLYVDEKRKLPIEQRTIYRSTDGTEKSIVTVGDKWSNFQLENFHAASQPQYAIVSTGEKALTKTKAYTPDADKFADWLRCGLNTFKNKE